MSNYLQVLKFCIASVCLMAAYLTFYAFSSVNIATRTNSECKASTFYCDKLFGRSNSFNCSSAALNSPEREKRLCSCEEKGKANSNKEESALDSAEQITRESISITHNPSDLTTRHINYFPPDEPSKKGLGALKLPDSLPWKSLELRLIYVLKVLHRSSRVVNVTHIINDLRAAIEIIEDIHTKLDLAYRSSDLISGPESDETHLNGLVNVDKEPSTDTYNLQNDTSYKPPDVCPETFKGTLYGYPFYETGWVKENCTHQKPMEELITIVLDFSKYSNSVASRNLTILDAIEKIYPGVKMIVAVNKELASNASYRSKFHQLSATWLTFPPKVKIGKVLNNLISKVTTPYTYIATGIFSMDEDSRLERLVRELSQLNASVIGSAKKDKEGIWSMNCYQMSYKNYTIIYRAGYDYSRHECVFCNFTEGPFLARTNFLKEHKLDESLQGPLVFRDYFFKLNRLEYSLAVCPDSMLHFVVRSVPGRHEWLQFAQKRHLNKIILANDITHEFSCQELRRGCNFKTGKGRRTIIKLTKHFQHTYGFPVY